MSRAWRIVLAAPVVWIAGALVASARGGMMISNGKATPIPWTDIFTGALYEFFWWLVIGPLIYLAVRRIASLSSPALRVGSYLLLGAVTVVLFWALRAGVRLPGDQFILARDFKGLRSSLPTSVGLYVMFLAASLTAIAFARAREREREAAALSLRASRLETQLVEAQLGILRAQLHPHFLFNSLHAISTLVDWRPKDARRMIVRLSELLRMALDLSEAREVTLARELDWLERYVELQQIRFGERLTFDMKASPDCVSAFVPPLILQPLVENALKHGVERTTGAASVSINAEREGKWLRIIVRDSGPGPAPVTGSGVGLRNVRERIKALYGDEQQVVLRSSAEGGGEVLVEVPWRSETPSLADTRIAG